MSAYSSHSLLNSTSFASKNATPCGKETKHRLHARVRRQAGRNRRPNASSLDSQHADQQIKGTRGYDAFKRLTERKRLKGWPFVTDGAAPVLELLILPVSVDESSRWTNTGAMGRR